MDHRPNDVASGCRGPPSGAARPAQTRPLPNSNQATGGRNRQYRSVRSAAVELDRIGGSGRALATASAAHAVDVRSAGVEILRPLRTAFGAATAAHAIAGI